MARSLTALISRVQDRASSPVIRPRIRGARMRCRPWRTSSNRQLASWGERAVEDAPQKVRLIRLQFDRQRQSIEHVDEFAGVPATPGLSAPSVTACPARSSAPLSSGKLSLGPGRDAPGAISSLRAHRASSASWSAGIPPVSDQTTRIGQRSGFSTTYPS